MLDKLSKNKGSQGLIIVPTRELAIQVEETFHKVAKHLGVRTALLIGGTSFFHQKLALRDHPHILIGTPGRMIDHLKQKTLQLSQVQILVLDEADRMLDMGFAPQIKQILKEVPAKRQTMLFSATMPGELLQIAHSYMQSPLRVEVAPSGSTAENIEQAFIVMNKDDKMKELTSLLREMPGTVLVFCRTKHGATKLTKQLRDQNFTAAEIHSNRSLGQRRAALDGFKSGRYRILVATDIAARGIDVKEIGLVLNYDLPDNPDDYVHRIGRTGRAGRAGVAISFAMPDQKREVETIERLVRRSLTVHLKVPFSLHGGSSRFAFRSKPARRPGGGGGRRGGFRGRR